MVANFDQIDTFWQYRRVIFLSGMIYLTSYNIIHIEVIDRLSIPIHIDTSIFSIDTNIIIPVRGFRYTHCYIGGNI